MIRIQDIVLVLVSEPVHKSVDESVTLDSLFLPPDEPGGAALTKSSIIRGLLENRERTIVVNTCLMPTGGAEELKANLENDSFAFAQAVGSENNKRVVAALGNIVVGSESAKAATNNKSRMAARTSSGTTITVSLVPVPPRAPSCNTPVYNTTDSTLKSCLRTTTSPCQPRKVSFSRVSEVQEFYEEICLDSTQSYRVATKSSCLSKRACKRNVTPPGALSKRSLREPSRPVKSFERLPTNIELGPAPRRTAPPLRLSGLYGGSLSMSQQSPTEKISLWSRLLKHCCLKCHLDSSSELYPEPSIGTWGTFPASGYYKKQDTFKSWISRHSRCLCS